MRDYWNFRDEVTEDFESMESYMLHKVFRVAVENDAGRFGGTGVRCSCGGEAGPTPTCKQWHLGSCFLDFKPDHWPVYRNAPTCRGEDQVNHAPWISSVVRGALPQERMPWKMGLLGFPVHCRGGGSWEREKQAGSGCRVRAEQARTRSRVQAEQAGMRCLTQTSDCLQDFPYNLLPGIEHHNLWGTHILTPNEIEEVA